MKTIYYISVGGESIRSGYYQKIQRTLAEWEALGYKTKMVIGASRSSPLAEDWNNRRQLFRAGTEVYLWSNWHDRIRREFAVSRQMMRETPSAIYVRNTYYSPALALVGLRIPLFVEINTVESSEFRGRQLLLRRFSNQFMFNVAKHLFAVTNEIRATIPSRRWQRKTSVISNGIDLNLIAGVGRKSSDGLHAVFLGAENRAWHGVED